MEERAGLRKGYTTGTCCGAAAFGAAWYEFAGKEIKAGKVRLPDGRQVALPVMKKVEDGKTWFAVRKDAGDDPDVTHGCLVYASVEAEKEGGNLYFSEEYPFLSLTGGPGIGVVTKPGLACPVGAYAINPVPRAMIFQAVGEVYEELGIKGRYLIRLKIPQGEALGARTFNPKLGIVGGISVLGTSGIVNPMSEEALKASIGLELHMKAAEGQDSLIIVPGSYGERFLKENLGLPVEEGVHCSNFVADTVRMAVRERIKKILFVGHIGKLVKVAGGMENTHSKYGDRRMEILARTVEEAGFPLPSPEDWKERLLRCNTTEEAVDYLEKAGCREPVMEELARKIQRQMNEWGEGKIQTEVVIFSSAHGILAMSRLCGAMIEEWRKGQT